MAGAGFQVGKGFTIGTAQPNPTAPSTSNGASGSGSLTGTVYYKVTFVYPNGESAPSGSSYSVAANSTLTIWTTTFPSGATAMNVYASYTSGQESYQGQQTTPGGSSNGVTMSSLATTGKLAPLWNATSYQDINPSVLGLTAGSEFIVHNIYYTGSIAFATWDGTTQVLFDADTTGGARMGVSIHCNAGQWLRVFNQSSSGALQVSFDGMQTA